MWGIRYHGFSIRPQVSACADESKRTKRKPFKHIDMEFKSIERESLEKLIASTKTYIAQLKEINDDVHFYQYRLAECNTYVCDDTRETIKMLEQKLSNYELTLTKFK